MLAQNNSLLRVTQFLVSNLEHYVSWSSTDLGDEKIIHKQLVREGEAMKREEFAVQRHSLRRRIVAHLEEDVVDPKLNGWTFEPNCQMSAADDCLASEVADTVNQFRVDPNLRRKLARRFISNRISRLTKKIIF